MSLIEKRAKLFLSSLVVFLTCGAVAIVGAQQKKSSPPPKPAPQHSAPSHPASRPSTPAHNTGPGARPGGNRPGAGRPNTGSVNRPGSMGGARSPNGMGANRGTMGNSGRGTMGNSGRGTPNSASRATRPLPGRQVSLRGGGTATIRPNGQIRSINRNGMQINRGLNGSRTVVSMHNGARVVTTGRNSGYVQRAYVTRGGRTYVSRTVVVNHVVYTSVYRSFGYHGYCCYYGYHPAFYYGPRFYGWAYNPWPAPVYWGWGWGGAPWYGFYGGYFAPYPVYPSAAFWLTDWLIAANLQAAYQAQAANAAAGGGGGGGGGQENGGGTDNGGGDQQANNGGDNSGGSSGQTALTPEVKQAIADEVKAQLAAQQQQSQQGSSDSSQQAPASASANSAAPAEEVPAALDPNIHMFIVASDLTVNADGQECQLTEGDVLKRTSDTPDDNQNVSALVESSKKSDCGAGKTITVAVNDLQEMHNKFEEQLDNGMKELSSKQGTGGIPQAPDATAKPSDVPPPPADNNAAKTLEDQQQAADQTEAQVKEGFNQGS
jgi:hypothetical protein